MRRAAALALLCVSACSTDSRSGGTPTLLRFLPPERGGPRALPEASPSGILDLSGPCVSLQLGPNRTTTIISTHDVEVGRDNRGVYLDYDGRRFRHGARVKGGGGHSDRLPADPLDGPVPAECRAGPFLIFYGFRDFDPSMVPPPKSPPPPGPVLIRYKPASVGGPDTFRMAILTGTLDFGGPCVRLRGPSKIPRVVVTSAGSQLGYDERGVFLPSGNDRLRHGDDVQAVGGEIGGKLLPAEIAGPIPTNCDDGPFVEAIGIHRHQPRSGPPEPEPPPPPVDQ